MMQESYHEKGYQILNETSSAAKRLETKREVCDEGEKGKGH